MSAPSSNTNPHEEERGSRLAQVLLTNWQLYGTFYQGDATSLAVGASDSDPIYKLPVMKVLGSLHCHGGLNVYWADIHELSASSSATFSASAR